MEGEDEHATHEGEAPYCRGNGIQSPDTRSPDSVRHHILVREVSQQRRNIQGRG